MRRKYKSIIYRGDWRMEALYDKGCQGDTKELENYHESR